jgi:voltage-gated potassium channel
MQVVVTKENQLGILNLIVFVLSVYVLLAILTDIIFVLPAETSILLNYIDNTICVFFFIEFCVRFFQAENKLKFMRWGWIDLISSIPAISYLRAGRVLRLIRLLRLIRAFRSTQNFINHVFRNKAQGVLPR